MVLKSGGAGAVGVALLALASCSTPTPEQLTIAAYNFPENQIIASIYAEVLENAGIQVARSFTYTSNDVLSDDFSNGTVDLVPEYLGSVTSFVSQTVDPEQTEPAATGDQQATLDRLRELVDPYSVVVGDPAPAANQLQYAVTQDFATAHTLTNLSDLAALNGQIVLGGPPSCPTMDVCQPGLEQTYGLQFKSFVPLDAGGAKTLNALQTGQVNLAMVLATDPAVGHRGLVILGDDKHLQVVGNVVPLVSEDAASDEVMDLIAGVNSKLTSSELVTLNGQVSIEGYPPEFVAARWAAAQGLIPAAAVSPTPVPVPPPTPTPTPTPTPEPAPAPEPPGSGSSGGGSGGGGGSSGGSYARNMGEPSAAAQSQNWPALAQCESGGDPTIVSSNGLYHGLYQFSVPTWQSMGGSGAASAASSDEQTYRAMSLWDAAGPGQWPVCGSNL